MNGLIIQWGFDSASGTSKTSKQFPLSFTSMWIGGASNCQGWATGNIDYIDNSHYALTSAYGSGTGVTDKVSWIAIGYQNGLIEQWGQCTGNTSTNFPIAFTNKCVSITANCTGTSESYAFTTSILEKSKTAFKILTRYTNENSSGKSNYTTYWIATGY